MTLTLSQDEILSPRELFADKAALNMFAMSNSSVKPQPKPSRPRNFFREWRKHRGFTQEHLAEMIGVSTPSISQLETGKQGFTDSTLSALAEALSCQPADLLMRNPLDTEAPWSIWDKLQPAERKQFIEIMKTLQRNGTDG